MRSNTENLTKAQRVRSILAASSGNFVEWFDFYIYLSLASYFTHHFSASDNEILGLIVTFGIFAIGFFMRPIGSLIFGSLADKIGRQKTMIYAIVLIVMMIVNNGSYFVKLKEKYSYKFYKKINSKKNGKEAV